MLVSAAAYAGLILQQPRRWQMLAAAQPEQAEGQPQPSGELLSARE